MNFVQWLINWFEGLFAKPAVTIVPPPVPEPVVLEPEKQIDSKPELPKEPGRQLRGCDISHWQTVSDWVQVAESVDFILMKATEGISKGDDKFLKNWYSAKAAGITSGAYHFFRAEFDGITQAQYFLKVVGDLEDGDLPYALDWETDDGKSIPEQIVEVKKFIAFVEQKTKVRPMLYSGLSHWHARKLPPEFAKYPLWLAHYGVSSTETPSPWKHWDFWQYTDKGPVAGIGTADCNYFNGDRSALDKLIKDSRLP